MKNKIANKNIDKILSDIVSVVEISANIKDYKHLKVAIFNVVKNCKLADSIAKSLYPFVIEKYNPKSNNADCSIGHAIGLI